MLNKKASKGEAQYKEVIKFMRKQKPINLGPMTGWGYYNDPKRLVFLLARYKFVSKMLSGMNYVLEVGCGDGFGTRIVAQVTNRLLAVDFDLNFIASATGGLLRGSNTKFMFHDMLEGSVPGKFDAAYTLDVLEHIPKKSEAKFLSNIVSSLSPTGVCVIGSPSVESQLHASKYSKLGHVNCKSQDELKNFLQKYFNNIFMFSMNDELIHTGFSGMSHYNLALCVGPKVILPLVRGSQK